MPTIRWSPQLFGALGAGFAADATVRDGVHLRWALDPRMGLPRSPREKGYEIAFSRTTEGSITRVDLFKPSAPYPVRSDSTVLPAGPGMIHRDGERLSFVRPLGGIEWAPYWRYRHHRALVDILGVGQGPEDRELLAYTDAVMSSLEPFGPQSFRQREDVVAVDVRFNRPGGAGGGGGIGPFVPNLPHATDVAALLQPAIHAPTTPDLADHGGLSRRDLDLAGSLTGHLGRFRPDVFATVQGFDHCDRLVAEDWVGRHPQIILGGSNGPFPARAGALKMTARLRAPGIRWIRVLRRPGHGTLSEHEIRWVFCDEYASSNRIWLTVDSAVMQTKLDAYTGDFVQDHLYRPFHAGSQPLDWDGLAAALRDQFLVVPEIQKLLSTPDTFETARLALEIEDIETPTGSSDDRIALPLFASLLAATVDPVIARIFGLYGYVPSNPDFQARDWRVLVRPPFGRRENLERLEARLRAVLDPGGPFLHEPGDSLHGMQLAGLVLDAEESPKPDPPDPLAQAEAEVNLVPAKPGRFDHLVHATLTAAPEAAETRPWRVNASYEVIRGLSGEPAVSIVETDDQGPLDEVGLLPDVLLPEFDSETCLSTGKLADVFARDASKDYELVYLVRGFDVFGRPSAAVATAPIDIPAACVAPPPPETVSARAIRQGETLTMTIDFDLGEYAAAVEAEWQALETLVNAAPLLDGVPPDQTEWTGTRPGRLIELGFDAALALQTGAVTQGCLDLSWSGGVLQRAPTTSDVCAAAFPDTAQVEPLQLTALDADRSAYRMTVGLGERSQYPAGFVGWTARLRVRGRCPRSGAIVHSPETTVRADLFLPSPAPPVVQPPVEALPLSTHPDVLGSSQFTLDLRTVLGVADQTADTLVKVYLARLDAIADRPEDFVHGETVTDPPGLIALAKLSKRHFTLVSDPPESFDPDRPHVEIEVPGRLSEVYVAAIQGADGVLSTPGWQHAAFVPFRTPPLRPLPVVEWTAAEVTTAEGSLTSLLGVGVRFPEPMPDPLRPPIVQLFRRDLSTGQSQARFVAVAEGATSDPGALRPEYSFAFNDGPLLARHRYEFAAQLLAHAPWRDQHVKIGGRLARTVAAPADAVDPFSETDPLLVTARAGGGFDLRASFAAGDVDIELVKEPDAGDPTVQPCRIEGGELLLADGMQGSLTTGDVYLLEVADPDSAAGLYRVLLRAGQSLTTSREARTP